MIPSLVDVLAWEVRVSAPGAVAWGYLVGFGAVQLDRYLHRRRMDGIVARVLDGAERGKVEA